MKTRTTPLSKANYVSNTGQLNLTRLTDDAVKALEIIHYNGVGRQKSRSRGVVFRSFKKILVETGYCANDIEAARNWRDQALAIFTLNINAAE